MVVKTYAERLSAYSDLISTFSLHSPALSYSKEYLTQILAMKNLKQLIISFKLTELDLDDISKLNELKDLLQLKVFVLELYYNTQDVRSLAWFVALWQKL